MVTEQPAGGEMKSLLPEAAVDEIKEDEPSETVVAAFEDVTGVKTEPESKIDAGGDIFVEASVSEDEGVQQIDAATVPVKDYQVPEPKIPENSEAAPNEEVSVVEETEENVPVLFPGLRCRQKRYRQTAGSFSKRMNSRLKLSVGN